jgi:hypothetical protein
VTVRARPYNKFFRRLTLVKFIIPVILFSLWTCERSTDFNSETNDEKFVIDTVYYFLSDSLRVKKSLFTFGEDIFYNFGVINQFDSTIIYQNSHCVPPIASFRIYHNDTLYGKSDEGYGYGQVQCIWELEPGDTVKYYYSWYSHPYHKNELISGEYFAIIKPYIRFEDFNIGSYLDTIYFDIIDK